MVRHQRAGWSLSSHEIHNANDCGGAPWPGGFANYLSAGGEDMNAKQQLLFVQGGGKGTHDEWDNKLVESLRRELGQDYEVQYPRMPREDDPSYVWWKRALERALETLRDGVIVVAHSVGATILLK